MPSIFQKDCPQCGADVGVQVTRCDCGYCFEPENGGDAAEFDAQQEQLYRDYLTARLAQAEESLTEAREMLAVDPKNTLKAAQTLVAEQAYNATLAELDALNSAAGTANTPTRVERRPVAVAPSATYKAATPEPATITPAPPVRAPRPPAPVAHIGGNTTPDQPFRRLQAAKANAALQAQEKPVLRNTAPAITPSASIPAVTPQALTPQTPQECPNCTASVPGNTDVCGCGYRFSANTQEVPSLALDAATLALLNDALSPIRSRR